MIRLGQITLCAAYLVGLTTSAQACAIWRPPPNLEQVKAAKFPKLGFVGKVVATFENEKTKASGEAIVFIEITRDFSGRLPGAIYVLNPGGGMCLGISTVKGEEIQTIVRRGDDGLFHLDY